MSVILSEVLRMQPLILLTLKSTEAPLLRHCWYVGFGYRAIARRLTIGSTAEIFFLKEQKLLDIQFWKAH